MNSLWIQYLFHEFTMNALSVSRMQVNLHFFSCIRCLLRKFIFNHFESTIDMAYSHEILFPRMHLKFKIWFAYSPWIHWPFFGITMNSLSISQIHYEFTICFAVSVGIHYLFAKSLWIHYSLFVSQIDFESTISSMYLLFIRESLTNSLSVSRNHFQYTIFFAHYFKINPFS